MDGNCDKTTEKKTDYHVACQSTRLVVFSICRMRLSDNASWIPRGLGSGSHWAEWQQFVTESTSTADTYRTIEICARWKLSIWLSDSNHTNAPWGERGWVTPTMSQYAVAEHIWCCFVSAEDVGRETEHCDEHVCLSVCLSVRQHNSAMSNLHQIVCVLRMALTRSSSGGVAICYVLPVYG